MVFDIIFTLIFELILISIYLFYIILFQFYEAITNYNNLQYFKDKLKKYKQKM